MTKSEFTEKCLEASKAMATAMRKERRKSGLTQKEMAEQMGVSTDYIRKVEQNKVKIPAFVIYEYCRILHLPSERFFKTGNTADAKDREDWIIEHLPSMSHEMIVSIQNIMFSYIAK